MQVFHQEKMDCLIMLFNNKTTKEIANILKISPRTVEVFIENIKQKSGCKNKLELMHELMRNNMFKSIARTKGTA